MLLYCLFFNRAMIMDLKKQKIIYLVLSVAFVVLTFAGAFLVFANKVDNAGYSVVSMLGCLVFNMLYRNTKKAIEENSGKD